MIIEGSQEIIRGILFDIGDTILSAEKLQQRALKETVNRLAEEPWMLDPEEFVRAYQAADQEPHFDELPDLNHLYSDPRIITRTFQMLSWPFTSEIVDSFLRAYRHELRSNIRPDKSLKEVFDKLKEQGAKLGIVSNGTTREQIDQLMLMQIREYFEPILISEEVGIRKPDPRILLLASDRWQVPPREILVVGDRGDWEIVGAHRAGMKSALTTQFVDKRDTILPEAKPDFIIDNLSELPGILQRYNAPLVSGSFL